MTAAAKGPGSGDDDGSLATQWFIVSDMGLTAFSGNDGIHVFVNSLASTEAVSKAEVRLVARNNEILATRKTDDAGHVLFEAGLARGEGGLSPALLTVMSDKADYAFLSLKTNAFDLTDRGVSGRVVPPGADAFVYAERGVYRSSETVYLTALLARRAGQRDGRRAADAGDRAAGRRRIPPRHSFPIRAQAAALLSCRSIPRSRPGPGGCAPLPTPRALPSARPPSWSRITSPNGSNSTSRPRRR